MSNPNYNRERYYPEAQIVEGVLEEVEQYVNFDIPEDYKFYNCYHLATANNDVNVFGEIDTFVLQIDNRTPTKKEIISLHINRLDVAQYPINVVGIVPVINHIRISVGHISAFSARRYYAIVVPKDMY